MLSSNFHMLVFLVLASLPFCSVAQDENLRYHDYIYKDNIITVQLRLGKSALSYPIASLNAPNNTLVLSFDDLDGDIKDYVYTIQHCNSDWTPSELTDMEYIDGFVDEKIIDFRNSFGNITPFTHYRLGLPNVNMRWSKSGNYLLKVYEDESEKELVITRRFMVVEPSKVQIDPKVIIPSIVSKSDTHHEVDFNLKHKGMILKSPKTEIKTTILQNGRWDNAILNLPPMFVRNEELSYDYMNKIVFSAGKEFRPLDIRSFRYRGGTVLSLNKKSSNNSFLDGIVSIERAEDFHEVVLAPDIKREFQPFLSYRDINGSFVIENIDLNRDNVADINTINGYQPQSYNHEENNLESDYAYVSFSLEAKQDFEDAKVYVFGELTDWQIQDYCEMEYNEDKKAYELELFLKQGYYNYAYAVVRKGEKMPDFSETEGNWYETQNKYTVLVYYRPFGARYDMLIATKTFASTDWR